MTNKLNKVSKFAIPALLLALMSGCATVEDLERVQKQVDEVRVTANSANATAQEARSIALDARSTANKAMETAALAEKRSSEASGFASAAMKGTELAVGTAVQAQKMVGDATVAIPWMRLDPATGRFAVQWIIWPSVGEYMGGVAPANGAAAPAADAPATYGPK